MSSNKKVDFSAGYAMKFLFSILQQYYCLIQCAPMFPIHLILRLVLLFLYSYDTLCWKYVVEAHSKDVNTDVVVLVTLMWRMLYPA